MVVARQRPPRAMPYVIAVYDVAVERNAKALRLFRRYLRHVQNSVFEGELTPSQLAELEAGATALLEGSDAAVLYALRTQAYSERRSIGADRGGPAPFV